jgi:copper chaperone CopZ
MRAMVYEVPDISCGHCEAAIVAEVGAVPAVDSVAVDLKNKVVTVTGFGLDDRAVRRAIYDAGYEAVAS